MDSFHGHPGKRRQQEVVQEEGSGDAETPNIGVESQPSIQQKGEVQKKQSQTQMDRDF